MAPEIMGLNFIPTTIAQAFLTMALAVSWEISRMENQMTSFEERHPGD
jgi:hypothetical protein